MHNRILINPTGDKNLIYISLTTIDKSFKATYHAHPNMEILLITSGEGKINSMNISVGDIILIDEHQKHIEKSNNKLEFYALGIRNIDFFSEENKILILHQYPEIYRTIYQSYKAIYYEASNKYQASNEIIESILKTIFLIIEREHNLKFQPVENNNDTDLIDSIKSFLDSYYYMNLHLEELADKFSSTVSTICHEFKNITGYTIMEYKINKQLEEASNLLKISDMTISEISASVGFNSSSYFIKCFKNKYQLTPKEYKNRSLN